MSRNGRPPRSSRCTAAGRSARQEEQAFVTGILTSRADFERAREWQLAEAADYDSYLLDTAVLLDEARRTFGLVQARMFHPEDFADFCLLHGLDPVEPGSRDRYLVNPPLQTQLLPYQGEELTGDFIPRLIRARESGLTLRHADLLVDGGLFEPDEETDPAVKRAYQSAAELFRRMLVGAGAGTYQFRCAVEGPGGRLTAEAKILHWEDGVVRINDEDLDLVVAVLCAGLYRELPGAAVLHGTQGSAGACGEYRQVSWAWQSTGAGYRPATARLAGIQAEPGFSLGSVC
ncbi:MULTISPECIES: hypothetical protein [unclassified Kitasatospora]|uniref:hypothetical protein n=1 Tax=unclassified Kitasatospora TaxID=2633591 RepID=UPI00070A9AF7|nr:MULTISPECIES: hypothetical protein [unclassified Kitasatospora]KQV22775.1 hypothetical protein ASC99_16545 [Kitasatospora sp. Root107]KRB61633.1 hypothetical protein ASE03_08355 [Kitasatospora sp. Root187]